MAQALLVNLDTDRGSAMVDALDAAGIKVNVALWAVLGEYGDWPLILSSKALDKLGKRDALWKVLQILDAASLETYDIMIMLFRTSDRFIRDLRRYVGKGGDSKGLRLGGQLFGDKFVEDSYVYRIS